MFRLSALALAAGLTLAAPTRAAAPLSAYGELPAIEEARVSPDGVMLALVTANDEKRSVVIETTADQKVVMTVKAGDKKLRDVRWAGPDHLLIEVSTATQLSAYSSTGEYWTVIDVDVKTRVQHTLLSDAKAATNVVLGTPQVRFIGGRPFAFVTGWEWVGDEGWPSLFKADLDANQSSLAARAASRNTDGWLVDQAGVAVAQAEFDDKAKRWNLLVKQPGGWRVAKTVEASIEHPYMVGFGADGQSLLLGDSEGGDVSIRTMSPAATDWGPPVARPGEDVTLDPATDEMIGTREIDGDHVVYGFLSLADQASWNSVLHAFPGEGVNLVSISADHRKLVVEADSPTLGPAYCLVDLNAKAARWIGPAYAKLGPADISPTASVAFKAADGLDITGYLTLPRGKDPKKLPLIVFPHGGPAARDEPGFDWWAQAMASRGYAVLQVNYRGSDGLGWKFMSAGFGEWGRKMQTDLSDGVRYLSAQGTIDPKRVCIVGASYGGYAALAGVTLDPGVYRCAVSVAGLSDLARIVGQAKHAQNLFVTRYWDRYMGAKNPDDPHLKEISPIDHVDKVTVPVMLIHGEDDTVVPYEQSTMMEGALKLHGKAVTFVKLNHEDHWLSHSDTRLQMLQATMDFVQKNNPAD
ncbi:MAG TPA: S9 family peptidase [Caulobacteraceae bacterium]